MKFPISFKIYEVIYERISCIINNEYRFLASIVGNHWLRYKSQNDIDEAKSKVYTRIHDIINSKLPKIVEAVIIEVIDFKLKPIHFVIIRDTFISEIMFRNN